MSDNPAPYRSVFTERAVENLKKLDKAVAARILKKIADLAAQIDTFPHYAMKGQWSGYYRLRVGDYRIIYMLDHQG